jgi:hypothetical protein
MEGSRRVQWVLEGSKGSLKRTKGSRKGLRGPERIPVFLEGSKGSWKGQRDPERV